MEYRIKHASNLVGFENMSFAIDIVKLTKSAKNRSFPNLSNCHQTPLQQKKFCAECGEEVNSTSCTHKQFKLGKEAYPISAEHLLQIKKSLDDDRIVIDEFREMHEIPELWFTDEIYAAKQHKKYLKEYREYAQILSQAGKVAVGQAIIRNRPYPVMIYPYQDRLVMRALHYFDEVNPMPAVDNAVQTNETKIGLMLKAVQLNTAKEPFSIGRFVNQREEAEEQLIAKCLRGEELPEVKREEMAVVDESDEIARLQALLAEQQKATPKAN